MARILAYTSPALGHLFPLTPILDELHRRGHQVVVRTVAGKVSLMRERGFESAPIDARVEALVLQDWRGRTPLSALNNVMRGFAGRAEFDAGDLRNAIANERPDAVLVDVNSWGALSAAEKWGGPWACFCPYPLTLRSRDVPPYGPGITPARGPLGRLRDTLLRPFVTGTFERIMLPRLNRVRTAAGLPQIPRTDDLYLRMPLLLYMTAEPFEYARSDWPPNIVMVGPCAWEPPADAPAWLESIERPIVLVTTSSEFQDDGRLIMTALKALADEPVHVVATVPAGTPTDFSVPSNANVERFIPHGPVLDRAVCAITHGGMGATQKALARGIPVCAVPFGRDQLEVARRVQVARAGTRLSPFFLSAGRLRAKVLEAMSCREGARRVADGYLRTGGAITAADVVEKRLLGLQ